MNRVYEMTQSAARMSGALADFILPDRTTGILSRLLAGSRRDYITALFALLLWSDLPLAQATVINISTSFHQITPGVDNQGFLSTIAFSQPTNDSYNTGALTGLDQYRSFFSFDLSPIHGGTVTAATLRLQRWHQRHDVVLNFFDVSTPATDLIATRQGIFDQGIFDDLGSGSIYGSYLVPNPSLGPGDGPSDVLSFKLNADAIADLNGMLGKGYFSIGAAVINDGYIFTGVGDGPASGEDRNDLSGVQSLRLTITPPVSITLPEPPTLGVLMLGLAGMCLVRFKHAAGRGK